MLLALVERLLPPFLPAAIRLPSLTVVWEGTTHIQQDISGMYEAHVGTHADQVILSLGVLIVHHSLARQALPSLGVGFGSLNVMDVL